jgi:hypothetical protein
MTKAWVLAGLTMALPACVTPTSTWKGKVTWPDDDSATLIAPSMEAGAALAAAAAIRELVKRNTDPGLFWGCASPEQGLDVVVFTGPTSGLYYVKVNQRFDRCGGPRGRVLDWWHVYAATPQGEVVDKAPPPAAEDPPLHPAPPSPEQAPLPTVPSPDTGAHPPAPPPPLAPTPPPEPAAPPSPPPGPAPVSR